MALGRSRINPSGRRQRRSSVDVGLKVGGLGVDCTPVQGCVNAQESRGGLIHTVHLDTVTASQSAYSALKRHQEARSYHSGLTAALI